MKATHVLLDLIARTKNAVRDLDNLNYRKMRKILMNDNCDDQSTIGDDGKSREKMLLLCHEKSLLRFVLVVNSSNVFAKQHVFLTAKKIKSVI